MACETQVVSTDCPSGPREILEDGKWGELVPINNIAALSNAIIKTINNPKVLPSNLVNRANKFNVENAVKQYLEVLTLKDT